MVKGLYVAGTGLMTNVHRIDVISNNLANVNTTGYKKDRLEVETFNNRLFTRINGSSLPYKSGAAKVVSEYRNGEYTAQVENGFFRVNTENGIDYSTSVKFFKDRDGYIRTLYKNVGGSIDPLQGDYVLGKNGPIYVGDNAFEVDDAGNITSGGATIDNIVIYGAPTVIGTMSAGIKGYSVMTDFEQGQLEMTSRKLDLALRGTGYFNLSTENGMMLSRDGSFTINNIGELIAYDGSRVQGLDGSILITSENFSINEFGEVIQDGEITDKIKITDYSNVADLEKVGGSYFREKPEDEMTGNRVEFTGEIIQGFLEGSNTNAISEMIRLIEMNRNYESSQKVVTTIDDMIGKAVNNIAAV
ncbi:flagellar basal body rod C-terminal domain-containing protein [Fusibacter ferrireducens]|uniref:Flagellar hook-basal body protein n=1 Tax=Fusibacter ferrireducens TaxID=2785058 RepID=A0ABR9ZVN0_9FIRM|nr:flagellar hook-basal body protein [Fusibacter ferrireducens]MBF4694527.1 flagellar hook-basal body protein [Fusibacter ferrireducens]